MKAIILFILFVGLFGMPVWEKLYVDYRYKSHIKFMKIGMHFEQIISDEGIEIEESIKNDIFNKYIQMYFGYSPLRYTQSLRSDNKQFYCYAVIQYLYFIIEEPNTCLGHSLLEYKDHRENLYYYSLSEYGKAVHIILLSCLKYLKEHPSKNLNVPLYLIETIEKRLNENEICFSSKIY